jgi:ABC-2 type transport system permease protein
MNWIGLYTLTRREIERTFRLPIQTLVTPWITALLYVFIFGRVVGSRIDLIAGVPYINFVLPGILMLNIIMGSFTASSSSVYFKRFIKDIEEILVAPLSYMEMIIGFTVSGVVRSVLIALGILVIAVFFGGASIDHIPLFLFYVASVSAIFSLLGIITGLWANSFEQFNILSTFLITPLSFLGGVFYLVDMLPRKAQYIAIFNPFFYFIDGIRYSMIGIGETSKTLGIIIILGLLLLLFTTTVYLFKIGWRLRE